MIVDWQSASAEGTVRCIALASLEGGVITHYTAAGCHCPKSAFNRWRHWSLQGSGQGPINPAYFAYEPTNFSQHRTTTSSKPHTIITIGHYHY